MKALHKHLTHLALAGVLATAAACSTIQQPRPPAASTGNAHRTSGARIESAVVSPDGRSLAHVVRSGNELHVVVVKNGSPAVVTARVLVAKDHEAVSMRHSGTVLARVHWMRWASPTRLVVETNEMFRCYAGDARADGWFATSGAIVAFDRDGGNFLRLATPNDFLEGQTTEAQLDAAFDPTGESSLGSDAARDLPSRSVFIPQTPQAVGFAPEHPDQLIVSAGSHWYRVNVSTGEIGRVDSTQRFSLRDSVR